MVALPSSLSARLLPLTPVYQGQYIHRRFRGWMSNTDILPIQGFTFFSSFIKSVFRGWHNYVVGLSLPGAVCDYFYCQAGGWVRIGFTVFYGWWSHLVWQWNPTLNGLWWLSHQCTLWDPVVTVFLNEKLDLWLWVRLACWPLSACSAFSGFLAGSSV